VTIQFSESVNNISKSTVQFFTQGRMEDWDYDDVGQLAPISYSPSRARLIVKAT